MIERRIKLAKFPTVKSLDSFDFKAMPSLNKMLVRDERRQLPPEPEPKKTENATKHLTGVEQPNPWLTRWAHRHLPRSFAPRNAEALHKAARSPPVDYRDNPQRKVLLQIKW